MIEALDNGLWDAYDEAVPESLDRSLTEDLTMWKRISCLGVYLVILGAAVISTPPAESSCSYHYSYNNSHAGTIDGYPVCHGTGGGCSEYGACDGSSFCVEDTGGGSEFCYFPDQRDL